MEPGGSSVVDKRGGWAAPLQTGQQTGQHYFNIFIFPTLTTHNWNDSELLLGTKDDLKEIGPKLISFFLALSH